MLNQKTHLAINEKPRLCLEPTLVSRERPTRKGPEVDLSRFAEQPGVVQGGGASEAELEGKPRDHDPARFLPIPRHEFDTGRTGNTFEDFCLERTPSATMTPQRIEERRTFRCMRSEVARAESKLSGARMKKKGEYSMTLRKTEVPSCAMLGNSWS